MAIINQEIKNPPNALERQAFFIKIKRGGMGLVIKELNLSQNHTYKRLQQRRNEESLLDRVS